MTDSENHLDLARGALDRSQRIWASSATPPKFSSIEQALIGIGHALLAIHEEMLRSAQAADEYNREIDRMYDRLHPAEPPADISGIEMEQP